MKTVMTGSQRRKKILELMRDAKEPLSGGALGKETGVSTIRFMYIQIC